MAVLPVTLIAQDVAEMSRAPDAKVITANILREAGFTEHELDMLFKHNPARVLGLE